MVISGSNSVGPGGVSLTVSLDGAVVVGIKSKALAGLPPLPSPFFTIVTGASGAGFAEKEVEKLVGDG